METAADLGRAGLPAFSAAVYRLVARVPKGKVVTYGQVAALLGVPRAPRAVGTALRRLPPPLFRTVPWQRVISASGGISIRGDLIRAEQQRWLLEDEGIEFGRHGKVDLDIYRWSGPKRWTPPKWKTPPPRVSGAGSRRIGGIPYTDAPRQGGVP